MPRRVFKLNVGGRRFETTAATLAPIGSPPTFFSSLLAHGDADADEYFIDRDGDTFAPGVAATHLATVKRPCHAHPSPLPRAVLNYLRSGRLHVPPTLSEAAVRDEATFYCVPLPPAAPPCRVRHDGLYISFGVAPAAVAASAAEGRPPPAEEEHVRAYLALHADGSGVLGRREADGQWSAMKVSHESLAGGLLRVKRRPARGEAEEEWPLELAAAVLQGGSIHVVACGRVGRLERPFHFCESRAPPAGSAFASDLIAPAAGRAAAGRVVLAFEEEEAVCGVMATSSQPGWSQAASSPYAAALGSRPTLPPRPTSPSHEARTRLARSASWYEVRPGPG